MKTEPIQFTERYCYKSPEPYTMDEVVRRHVKGSGYEGGQLETLEYSVDRLTEVVALMARKMSPEDQISIAKALYFDPILGKEEADL